MIAYTNKCFNLMIITLSKEQFNYNNMLHRFNKVDKAAEQNNNLLSLLAHPPTIFLKKPPLNPPSHHLYLTEQTLIIEVKKVLAGAEQELQRLEIVEATELLRKGKEMIKFSKDKLANNIILANLGICYYKIGLLEQAFKQFSLAEAGLKEYCNQKKVLAPLNYTLVNSQYYNSLFNRIKLKRIRGRICLQICILFSQLGKHDMAMKYAKIGCKIHYNLAYDILIQCNGIILRYLSESKYFKSDKKIEESESFIELPQTFDRILNLIGIMTHLLQITRDLKDQLLNKSKEFILQSQQETLSKYGKIRIEVDLQAFMADMLDNEWVFKNKILNQVQLECFMREQYQQSVIIEITNNQILQSITFLAVSFYCLSTEVRFLEKSNNIANQNQILDSQHWLSTSLEIAYTFLPTDAPILGQVYSVHNKFHGIDKQAIPQDKEMEGSVKVLKPLRRPKSIYNAKTTMISPILIRIQTPKIIFMEEQRKDSDFVITKKVLQGNSLTMELEGSQKSNQKVKGIPKQLEYLSSLEKIYKHQMNKTMIGIPKLDVLKKEGSSIQKRKLSNPTERDFSKEERRPHSNENFQVFKRRQNEFQTIDILNNVEQQQRIIRKNQNPKNIQINNNINLFITNQVIGKDDPGLAIELNKKKQAKYSRNVILKVIQSGKKQISKRNTYYGKRKISSSAIQQNSAILLPQF